MYKIMQQIMVKIGDFFFGLSALLLLRRFRLNALECEGNGRRAAASVTEVER